MAAVHSSRQYWFNKMHRFHQPDPHDRSGGIPSREPTQMLRPNEKLREVVEHAAHFLPTQGPIGVFVHHNTLHAFQSKAFERAVLEASDIFQTEPYLSEENYQTARAKGRILDTDIIAILEREPDVEILPGKLTRTQLRKALLAPGVRRVNGRNIRWHLQEGDWLEHFRSDLDESAQRTLAGDSPSALWQACAARIEPDPAPSATRARRPKDAVLFSHGINLDEVVHPPLIRLTGAYLDQGIAYWPMPFRELGLLVASRRIMGQSLAVFPNHLGGAGKEFTRQERFQMDAEAVVLEMLGHLGVPEVEWEQYLTAELVALAGWAGMLGMLERDPSLAPHDRVRCSLMEFLALRLSYTVVALRNIIGNTRSWRDTQIIPQSRHPLTGVARFFDAMQLLGYNSATVRAFSPEDFNRVRQELAICNERERRRLLHLAYEYRHEQLILPSLFSHRKSRHLENPEGEPQRRFAAQVMFCIDEREESMRRALEETNEDIETIGAAGFFGVAIDYAGIDDAGGVSLCPVVVKPAHTVREQPATDDAKSNQLRQLIRRIWAKVVRNWTISSRTLVRGWISTACLGFLSIFPLILRVLSPLTFARWMKVLNGLFLPSPKTELQFMRNDEASRDATTGLLNGFTTDEQADRVAAVLGPAGYHRGHARLVLILGHGSTSLNNPYESAYCCGACGGRTGAPNSRLFALIANRPAVREALKSRGIEIPEDTWFVGGYHDTCSDDVEYFDLDLMPVGHQTDLANLQRSIDEARARNAHERTRRFALANSKASPARSLRHVEERAEHIGEPRPEYGHCTNAVAFVGRRECTRGLFLDRRAFLVSYDATKDPADTGLARVLGAVIPVCGGISLEYYFSTVDNEGYGSGTKLPHNISGLVGVMNGFQGDLRTGLPLQTVEIHEPVRILFVVETTPERLMKTIKANPELTEFLCNGWIRLATMDPEYGSLQIYRAGGFEKCSAAEVDLPEYTSSQEYYSGKSEHLPPARILTQRKRTAA